MPMTPRTVEVGNARMCGCRLSAGCCSDYVTTTSRNVPLEVADEYNNEDDAEYDPENGDRVWGIAEPDRLLQVALGQMILTNNCEHIVPFNWKYNEDACEPGAFIAATQPPAAPPPPPGAARDVIFGRRTSWMECMDFVKGRGWGGGALLMSFII